MHHCLGSVKMVAVVQTSPQTRWLERMLEQHVDGSVPRFFLSSSCSGASASIWEDVVEIVLWPRLPVSMLSFSGRGANGGCVRPPFQENYVEVAQLIPQERAHNESSICRSAGHEESGTHCGQLENPRRTSSSHRG